MIEPSLVIINRLLMLVVWLAPKALVLNLPSRRQAGLPLQDAEFDRRAGDERQVFRLDP
jgi:hypothetical protein